MMPELPEVTAYKKYIDDTSLHHRIADIEVSDTKIVATSASELKKRLTGHSFETTEQYGKYLFLKLNKNGYLYMHFGMTGWIKYDDEHEKEALPNHAKVIIHFDNGAFLAFVNRRKLGRVGLTNSIDDFKNSKNLGTDVLQVSKETFLELLENKKGMIKSTLMDQHLISGIGNEYSDEILYQAKVHPETKVNQLSKEELVKIFDKTQYVLKTATRFYAVQENFPDHFLLRNRKKGAECPNCSGKIEVVTVGGRSAYYCSSCQKKI